MCGCHLARRCVGCQEYPRGCPVGSRGPTGAHSTRYVPPNFHTPSHLDTDANDNTHPGTTHHHADATQPDVAARSHTGRRSANPCPIPDVHPSVAHAHAFAADSHPAAANCHTSSSMDCL
jgi:hypothetical protein